MLGFAPPAAEAIAHEALDLTRSALKRLPTIQDEIYYAFADKTIVPTFLSRPLSRREVDTLQPFWGLRGTLRLFPAFGASMSFMRARFARDLHAVGGLHLLPRVGFTSEERLADVCDAAPALVGTALGIREEDAFLDRLLAHDHLVLLSIDIAHGANAAVLPLLAGLRERGLDRGVILGNVGSVDGFLYASYLMRLSGFTHPIIKLGVGPGSVCTTRINTGVGVGQFTLLERIATARKELGVELGEVQVIGDGGVNAAGDFAKALAFADGVMMGKFFASGSFEEEVLVYEEGELVGVRLFGMASALVTEKRNYIEGSSQLLRSFHHDAGEAVRRLREGLQSAMTYVDAEDLSRFRENVRFSTNSRAAIVEGGVH